MNIADYIDSPIPIQRELDFFFRREDPLTIFDIGACEGEDSVRYKRIFKRARICSFEPLPKNLLKIKETLERYNLQHEIEIVPVALSNSNGIAKFFVSSGAPHDRKIGESWDYGNKSSSLLAPSDESKKHHPWLEFDNQIDVQTQRLDSFCGEKKIIKVDFIHMDVQGAELQVLTGAGSFLHTINAIWLEVENVALYKAQPLKGEIEVFMNTHGFIKLVDTVNHLSGDQFYYNKKYISSARLIEYRLLSFKDRFIRKMMRLFKK